jgi:hypothetical protein
VKISELAGQTANEVEDITSLNLDEVEKTAELLDALSEEDSLIDDLARLAVLQDMTKEGGIKPTTWQWIRPTAAGKATATAKSELQVAKKARNTADIKADVAKVKSDTEVLNRKAGILDKKNSGLSVANVAIPAVVGAGAAAAGTGLYFKNREDQMMSEFEIYVKSLQAQLAKQK